MKKKKVILISSLAIAIVGVCLGIYFFQKKGDKIANPYDYLVFNQNKEAMLRGVEQDFPIEVILNDSFTYQIQDSNGSVVDTILEKKEDYAIIKPKSAYQKGETYVITIQNGSFKEEQLKSLKTFTFTIKRDKVEHVVFKDTVKEVKNLNITGNTFQSNEQYQVGDIILVDRENAYKIDKISPNGIYEVSIPEIEELYEELDVYFNDTMDIREIVATEEFKEYLAYTVSQTPWYQNLISTVEAAPNIQVKIDTSKKKIVTVSVIIVLPAKEEAKFIKALDNHNLTIKVEFEIEELKGNVDMKLKRQDADFTLKLKNTMSVSVDFLNASFDNFAKDDLDKLKDFTTIFKYEELIKKYQPDQSSVTSTIGGVKVPVGTTGLSFQLDFGILLDYEMKMDAGYEVTQEQVITIGFHHELFKEFEVVGNTQSNTLNKSAYIAGEAEAKIGFELETGFNLFNIAEGNLVVDGGLYGEAELKFSVSDILEDETYEIYAKGEIGLFLEANIKLEVLKNTSAEWKIYEKKWMIDQYEETFSTEDEPVNKEDPIEDEPIEEKPILEELDPNMLLSSEIQTSLQEGFKKYMENDYRLFHSENMPDYVFKGLRANWDPCDVKKGELCYGSESHVSEGTGYHEGFTIYTDLNTIKYTRHYSVNPDGGKYYYPYYSCTYNYLSKEVSCDDIDNVHKMVFDSCTLNYQFYDGSEEFGDGYGTDFKDIDGCVTYLMGEEVKSPEFYQPIFNKILQYANLSEKDFATQ